MQGVTDLERWSKHNTIKLCGEVEECSPIPGISEAYGHHMIASSTIVPVLV
jgi:hypothetical protein